MEVHKQHSKCVRTFWRQVIFIVFAVLIYSPNYFGQVPFLGEVLKQVDKVNQVLLDVTALSDDEENSIGIDVEKKVSADFNPGLPKKFNVSYIFSKVEAVTSRKGINYRFKVIEKDDFNAFTIIGGMVYIQTGLLNIIANDDELAFLIGHEIAHNEQKHCAKSIQYQVRANQVNPTLGLLVQVAYNQYHVPFSKYDEYEADEVGLELMRKAGFSKSGALSFFEKLYKIEQQGGQGNGDPINDFISTHPQAKDRKSNLEGR